MKLILEDSDLAKLSQNAKNEILALLCDKHSPLTDYESIEEETDYDSDTPIDLSYKQANQLIAGISDKTKSILKHIVINYQSGVYIKEISEKFEIPNLAGVWAGLTKRTRTVTGETDVLLFHWEWIDDKDDYKVILNDVTLANLKKILL